MPHCMVSDLGLHCLPMTLLLVSWQELVKTVSKLNVHMHVEKNVMFFSVKCIRRDQKTVGTAQLSDPIRCVSCQA